MDFLKYSKILNFLNDFGIARHFEVFNIFFGNFEFYVPNFTEQIIKTKINLSIF